MSMRDHFAPSRRVSAPSRTPALACVVASVVFAGCGNAPQDPVTEFSSELALQGSGASELRRQLAAGTWLVEVRERGIDVRVTVETLEGRRAELHESTPRHGALFEVVSLSRPAELRVMVSSADHPATRGRALVRLARFRPAEG